MQRQALADYFFVVFPSSRTFFAMRKTNSVIIRKFIRAPRKEPHLITMGPRERVAFCHFLNNAI